MAAKIRQLLLDDITIAARTEGYPPDVREGSRWLAGYIRRRHAGQINSLIETCKKLNLEKDYTYFNRILNGKYFLPDRVTQKIVGSPENFLELMTALRKLDQSQSRAGLPAFIETPTWFLVRDYIDKKRWVGRINKFGGIIGHTGTQKTACVQHYAELNNHGMVVKMESPVKPRMTDFITDLARCYGIPATAKSSVKKSRISESVNEHKTIIIENVQRLYNADEGDQQEIFGTLQKIQDETQCTIIMTYTPAFARVLSNGNDAGYFEQFVGRMGGLRKALILPPFATKEDVRAIGAAFKLEDLDEHLKYLQAISRQPGRIRVLFDDLQEAKQLAESSSSELTVDYLLAVRNETGKKAQALAATVPDEEEGE
jgi:DNA transposition AAA+ family ATPase